MLFPKLMHVPQKTIAYQGAIKQLSDACASFGTKGVLVHGRSLEKSGRLANIKNQCSDLLCWCHTGGEPTIDAVQQIIDFARASCAQWIVGIGGGSVLDAAKAAAGLYHAKHAPEYYQMGGMLDATGIPFIAVPTTAGTGSEATNNAVIINRDTRQKLSIRDESFLARVVILDATLLQGISKECLCYAAMDALVQAYEAYISRHATWYSETCALKALAVINDAIEQAYDSQSLDSLQALLYGSYLAGLALASARLGVIHGLAHPLGVLYDVPHGLVCAACFQLSLQLHKKHIGNKYDTLCFSLNEDAEQRANALLRRFHIESPFINRELIEKEKIIEEALQSGSTKADPLHIERAHVAWLLTQLFQQR